MNECLREYFTLGILSFWFEEAFEFLGYKVHGDWCRMNWGLECWIYVCGSWIGCLGLGFRGLTEAKV